MDQLKESLHIALTNLGHNAVRSMLSILGVVIGIAAVITVLSIGAGAQRRILEQINAMGVNVYTITGRYDQTTQRLGTLELDDIARIKSVPSVVDVTPQLSLYKRVRSRTAESQGNIVGADASTLKSRAFTLIKGRNFSPIEVEERATVCLIDAAGDAALFNDSESPIGQTLLVDGAPWEVIGVFSREKLLKRNVVAGYKPDPEIWAPLNTLLRSTKDISIRSLEVQVKLDAAAHITSDLTEAIERNDPHRKGLFSVRDQKDFYARTMEIQKGLFMIGALVACISLIVGGIGMMNVMLTSVGERTREIGIRRAVGARKKDILFQFLVESCLLSLLGGVLGLLFGAALARALPVLFRDHFTVAPVIRPTFVLLAVSAGISLGIVFGFYPAIKASKLSPAEALRTE